MWLTFLQNIKGKVTINFDSYYETILDELNEYYNSYEYEDKLKELKYNATANQYIIKISYGLNLDNFSIYDYNYTQYYNSVDEFIHKNKERIYFIQSLELFQIQLLSISKPFSIINLNLYKT